MPKKHVVQIAGVAAYQSQLEPLSEWLPVAWRAVNLPTSRVLVKSSGDFSHINAALRDVELLARMLQLEHLSHLVQRMNSRLTSDVLALVLAEASAEAEKPRPQFQYRLKR